MWIGGTGWITSRYLRCRAWYGDLAGSNFADRNIGCPRERSLLRYLVFPSPDEVNFYFGWFLLNTSQSTGLDTSLALSKRGAGNTWTAFISATHPRSPRQKSSN